MDTFKTLIRRTLAIAGFLCMATLAMAFKQNDILIWTGNVNANGQRINSVQLIEGRQYYIVARGFLSQGTWSQNGRILLNDACYEFNARPVPEPLPILQNNLGIALGDNQYHTDHAYISSLFVATGQPITFWIFDTDYRDNSGTLQVEIHEVPSPTPPVQTDTHTQVNQGSGAFCAIAPTDRLFWSGDVSSLGQRITTSPLVAGNKYYVVVRGFINQGIWEQNGRILLNDACYEFNAKPAPDPLPIFQNNLNITVSNNQYHPDHIYCSAPFESTGQSLSFWLFDTDYRDNSGTMRVELYEVTEALPPEQSTPPPQVTQGSGAFCAITQYDILYWSGNVGSLGQRITSASLRSGIKYYIVVRGSVNFGTWSENGRTLLNDACYEFNAKPAPDPLPIFQNNKSIPVCDNLYHPDHIYCSSPFESNGQSLTFWLYDTDYRDNSGSMQVEIYEVGEVDLAGAIDELTEEDQVKWTDQMTRDARNGLNNLLDILRSLYNQFNINYSKFVNEYNDRNSNPLQNEIIALCIGSAHNQFNDHQAGKDTLDALGNAIIAQAATNKNINMFEVVRNLSEVQDQSEEMAGKLEEMKNLLTSRGGDVDEIITSGQQLLAQNNVNPEFAQDGGVNIEFFGDGIDNFGNGLQDYLFGNVRRGNVLIVVWDAGNIADDIFEVSLSGMGSLGETPPGGRRNFDISLSPGTYTLTIRGVFTDPNTPPCTYGVQVYDRDTLLLQESNVLETNQELYYTISIH